VRRAGSVGHREEETGASVYAGCPPRPSRW
jgi:hypothetical protein